MIKNKCVINFIINWENLESPHIKVKRLGRVSFYMTKFFVYLVFCIFYPSDKPLGHLSPVHHCVQYMSGPSEKSGKIYLQPCSHAGMAQSNLSSVPHNSSRFLPQSLYTVKKKWRGIWMKADEK